MIEINLRPGSDRRRAGRRLPLSLPKRGGGAKTGLDRWVVAIAAAWLVAPAIAGWLFLGVESKKSELETALAAAEQDSARYARIIETTSTLQARRDTIAEKLQIIQQIDAGRYVWAHIMDETARALPEFTWLTGLSQTASGTQPRFRLEGRTGTTFALTRYLTSLEASAFIREVRLTSTEQVRDGNKMIYNFVLEGRYEEPDPELIDMVPVFQMTANDDLED